MLKKRRPLFRQPPFPRRRISLMLDGWIVRVRCRKKNPNELVTTQVLDSLEENRLSHGELAFIITVCFIGYSGFSEYVAVDTC